jgi:hypothetical protein
MFIRTFFFAIHKTKVYIHVYVSCIFFLLQIERPLQKHGGRLEHDEKYCGSCFGAEEVHLIVYYP